MMFFFALFSFLFTSVLFIYLSVTIYSDLSLSVQQNCDILWVVGVSVPILTPGSEVCIVDHISTANLELVEACLFLCSFEQDSWCFAWSPIMIIKKHNGMCWTRAIELTGACSWCCILIPSPMHVKKKKKKREREKKGRPRNCANKWILMAHIAHVLSSPWLLTTAEWDAHLQNPGAGWGLGGLQFSALLGKGSWGGGRGGMLCMFWFDIVTMR